MYLCSIKSEHLILIVSVMGGAVFNIIAVVSGNGFSKEEQLALQKLRPLVQDALYRDYMHDDAYLLPWLRRSNLDVPDASKALRRAHQWRKDNNIDTIVSEDYSKFEKELPYFLDGTDREGRPIIAIQFGSKWDVRKHILAGNRHKYNLYFNRVLEEASIKARRGFNSTQGSVNRNIPDWILVVDLAGYNLRQHACLACVPALLENGTDWDLYFPGMTNCIAVNAPRIFEDVLRLLRPLLAKRTNRAILIFGLDKQEWSIALSRRIAPDQLRPNFGGTKKI